jgi:glycosyltransferase involved in cell wall biosynthesis
LARRGLHVEVLTPRYATGWSQRFYFRDILVHRPLGAPRFEAAIGREWSVNRYIRSLATWIREQGRSFDVILVDRAREELVAAVEASKTLRCATLVRIGQWGPQNDLHWWSTGRSAARCFEAVRATDGVIAKSASDHRALVSRGLAPEQLFRIDDGFASGTPRSADRRSQARKMLAAVNRDLHTGPDTPVMLCCGPMTSTSGMNLVARSARVLGERYPDLRFWLVGDGPSRDSIDELVRGEGVGASVAMPGSFATLEDVFSAADLFVQPDSCGLESIFRSAVSFALPTVVVDTPETRGVLERVEGPSHGDQPCIGWFEQGSVKSLRSAARTVLDDKRRSLDQARQLRRWLCRYRPRSATIDAYVELIERAAAGRTRVWSSRSIETAS